MSQCIATADMGHAGDTVRCWRHAGHPTPHMAPDGVRWAATETPASAPLLDADGPSGQFRLTDHGEQPQRHGDEAQ